MNKVQFLSDQWLAALQQVAQHRLDENKAAPAHPVSYAEIFTDVPAAQKTVVGFGYRLSFADGKASVVRADREDMVADCVVRIDYNAALATMQFESGPEVDAIVKKAYADGKLTMSGSAKNLPIDMNSLHNALIEQTAPQQVAV